MYRSYHRLSAILFSDIVGYTSMMGENEENTLNLLDRNKRIHCEAFKKFKCVFNKQIGDAFLAVFDSALDAVYAGGFIQEECGKKDIPLRIGIHQGEVFFKDNDVFGDDVNIASRIEGSAAGGKIYVSEMVKRSVENKTGIEVSFVGEHRLKNVKNAINLYSIKVDSVVIPDRPNDDRFYASWSWLKRNWYLMVGLLMLLGIFFIYQYRHSLLDRLSGSGKNQKIVLSEKSIAVFPLKNISSDTTMEYLGDGFADHIIISLSRIPEFKVIARSSSFQYKKSEKPLREIANELGVQNVLEGSFQVVHDQIHLSMNLIHGPSGEVLYAETYDGKLEELFDLQDEVAENMTNIMVGSFLKFRATERKEKAIDLQAFKFYQHGQSLLKENYVSRNSLSDSRVQFQLAIKKEPSWSAPYIGMAETYLMALHYGYVTLNTIRDSLELYIEKASSINPEQGIVYSLKGDMAFWKFDFQTAFDLYEKAIGMNPNYPNSYYYQGVIYLNSKYIDEGLMKIEKAISLDPLNERYHTMKPMFLLRAGRQDEAMKLCQKMLKENPESNTTLFMLGLVYSVMKKYEDAINTLMARSVGHQSNWLLAYNYAMIGDKEKAMMILDHMLQLPEDRTPPPAMFAIVYLGLKDYEKSISYMEESRKSNDLWFIWLDFSWSDPVREDPRFIEIINSLKININ